MKTFKLGKKLQSKPEPPMMEEGEDEGAEEEMSPAALLREAADLCEDGDHSAALDLIDEAVGLIGEEGSEEAEYD